MATAPSGRAAARHDVLEASTEHVKIVYVVSRLLEFVVLGDDGDVLVDRMRSLEALIRRDRALSASSLDLAAVAGRPADLQREEAQTPTEAQATKGTKLRSRKARGQA